MTRAQYLQAREQILLAYERGRLTLLDASRSLGQLDRGELPQLTPRPIRAA